MGKMMLIDTSRCISCRACQVACKMWHALPPEEDSKPRKDLTGTTLTLVREIEAEVGGRIRRLFFKMQCRHCEDPRCKLACPLKAIKKLKNGAVVINPDICNPLLCSDEPLYLERPCQRHCMFKNTDHRGIPRFHYEETMRKCDLCYDRIRDGSGRKTACANACPTGAIVFGSEDNVWGVANRRLKKAKKRYPNANVGGLVAGPSHVIWLLTQNLALYGVEG